MPRAPADLDLGKLILAARLRRGLTQRIVSRRAGLDPGYLSRIEHGKIRPSIEMGLRIARALGVPLGELFELPAPGRKTGPCPVSASGRCLIDLMDPGSRPGLEKEMERYSARQLRLLRQFAAVLARGERDVLKAFETLIKKVLHEQAGKSTPPPARPSSGRPAR
jgi:transcriptional regulator with XRE-family HTH domain